MQQVFKARYFDGKSSKPYTVFVSIESGSIVIQTEDEKSFTWERSDIHETDFSSAIVTIRYGNEHPYQQLEITDHEFIDVYRKIFHISFAQRWLHFGSTSSILGLLVLGVLVSIVAGYLYVLPFVADRVAQHFPMDYEVSMGAQIMDSYLSDAKIDDEKTETINLFFKQLNIQTEYPIKIVVVKDSVVNAFAMPGGGIVVYDEMLQQIDKPEQLAALLSHEFSHVQLKHATRNIFRSIAGSLFISIVLSDANGIANLVIENAHQLRNLKYSRELEHEADENGLNILRQNRIDASGMSDLFLLLKLQQRYEPEEIVSTHPDLDSRIQFVKSFQKEHDYAPASNDSLRYYFNQLRN
jgi:predicted Zn-dependent protease